jgi:D-alanyl-D-alanine carboxypeptidase
LQILIRDIHKALGIPEDYGTSPMMPVFDEPESLVSVGPNIIGKEQRLTPRTADAWKAMSSAAGANGIALLIVSGFRGINYQAELFKKKLAAGQSIKQILSVNAAPGFSQHHTGRAIDIATPDSRPLTLEFESTPAFTWLTDNAGNFGFTMPYERHNRWGIEYEPWHWFFSEDDQS